jgi:hypothetical protein
MMVIDIESTDFGIDNKVIYTDSTGDKTVFASGEGLMNTHLKSMLRFWAFKESPFDKLPPYTYVSTEMSIAEMEFRMQSLYPDSISSEDNHRYTELDLKYTDLCRKNSSETIEDPIKKHHVGKGDPNGLRHQFNTRGKKW